MLLYNDDDAMHNVQEHEMIEPCVHMYGVKHISHMILLSHCGGVPAYLSEGNRAQA